MTLEKQAEKSIDDLLAEFKVLVSHADEVRRKMKELTRQIEAHGVKAPLLGRSSHEIDIIPKPPAEPM